MRWLQWTLIVIMQLPSPDVRPGTSELSGTFTLFLYDGRYAGDLQNVVILDKEGDPYTFEIYAPAFDYKIRRGVPADKAI